MSRFPLLIVALAAVLGGCANPLAEKVGMPTCPSVDPLDDANRITVYRSGPGRDITDIVYEARIVGIDSDCAFTIKEKADDGRPATYSSVTLNLRPRFRVLPGPAMTDRVSLDYFVAIPEFYPHPQGRAEFSREVELPANRTAVEVIDSNIDISVPLNENRSGESVQVYVGFALSEEQLRDNRSRTGGRLEP